MCKDFMTGHFFTRRDGSFSFLHNSSCPSFSSFVFFFVFVFLFIFIPFISRGRRSRDRTVVGLTTIYAITTYHH